MGFLDRLQSEVAYLRGALRTLNRTKPVALNPHHVLCDLMEEAAARFADRPALIGDDDGGGSLAHSSPAGVASPPGPDLREKLQHHETNRKHF